MADATCSAPNCDRPIHVKARELCSRCYQRWRKHGDTERVDHCGRWAGDDVGYMGMHHRVRRLYGDATGHTCRTCGAQAKEWAYDHADPSERISEEGKPYSVAPAHYMPLCRLCHRMLDATRYAKNVPNGPVHKTHCKHGHPFDEENTYVRPDGDHDCRACSRERCRARRRRARKTS